MSFGLGYFEDGIWVDHSNADATRGAASADEALDAVHRWYGCCADATAAATPMITPIGIADETDRPDSVLARATVGTGASAR